MTAITNAGSGFRMIPKLAIVAFLIAIVVALFFGMSYLIRDPSSQRRTLKALTWRVGLQVGLIAFLALAYFLGWIQPHGLKP